MPEEMSPANLNDNLAQRAKALFESLEKDIHQRIDRMFALLMLVQWFAAIAAALWLSPRTWTGGASQTHLLVGAPLLLGGTIPLYPVFRAGRYPGATLPRHAIAVGQLLMSGL